MADTPISTSRTTPTNEADPPADLSGLELLGDVDLHVKVELGRTRMLVEDVLRLNEGAVVELDKLAGDPVDVYVNNQLVARGEVLVLNDNFCIRISEIVANLDKQAEAVAQGAGADGGNELV
jgi:flagellar motor switch protein FliN/FliY